jgi:hypothetical protein
MLDDVVVTREGSIEELCFTVDGDIGRLYFTLETQPGGTMTITRVAQPSDNFGSCSTASK